MPHPVRYVGPSGGPLLLAPKRAYPLLPPPPPPPPPTSGLYKSVSASTVMPGCWAPLGVLCGPGPVPLPIPIPGPTVCRDQKERKLICIRDPSTGQDVTHEILQPAPATTCTFQVPHGSAFTHNQRQMVDISQLLYPPVKNSLPRVSWYEPPQMSAPVPVAPLGPPLPRQGQRSSSPPCLCCTNSTQSVSWMELVGLVPRKGTQLKQYSRDFLLSLRFQPLSLTPPKGLPDLSRITKSKSPPACSSSPSGDRPSRPPATEGMPCSCSPGPLGSHQQQRKSTRGSQRSSFSQTAASANPRSSPVAARSRSLSLGQQSGGQSPDFSSTSIYYY